MTLFILHALVCFKWGAWKRWKEYYSTILYVMIGNLSYTALFSDRLLWKYEQPINYKVADMFYVFLVFPAAVILFLTHYPKGWIKEFLYISVFTTLYTAIEYVAVVLGYFHHYHGWNIMWSAILYFFAFVLIKLHTIHPLIVWPISLVFAILTMVIFGQPLFGT